MEEAMAEMLRYNAWANAELFEACRSLSDEQLDARVAGVSGSVRELLVHIAGGQQSFVLRTKGRQHEGALGRDSDWPGIDTLIDIVTTTSDELISIAQHLVGDEEVALHYQGKLFGFPKRFFLVHAVQHGLEHRTEVKVALGHVGIQTRDLDGWFYSAATGYGQEIHAGS